MTNENNQNQNKPTLTYADFLLPAFQPKRPTFKDLSPNEIYALLQPRHGAGFAEWFVDQYKRKQA